MIQKQHKQHVLGGRPVTTEECILGNVLYITVLSIITNCYKINKSMN